MRVLNLNLKAEEMSNGLSDVKMSRLGKVVALFGANGSGKTRLLKAVANAVQQHDALQLNRIKSDIPGLEAEVERLQKILEVGAPVKPPNNFPGRGRVGHYVDANQKFEHATREHPNLNSQLESLKSRLNAFYELYGEPIQDDHKAFEVFFASSTLLQWAQLTSQLNGAARKLRSAGNPLFLPFDVAPHQQSWDEMKEVVEKFLGKALGHTLEPREQSFDVIITLDNRPLVREELSDGEQLLLRYAFTLFYGQKGSAPEVGRSVKGAIVIIDEPESHLHPAAQIHLFKSVCELVGETGQVWIASHSVSLLSQLNLPGELWIVESGKVKHPGIDRGHEALRLLYGSEEHLQKLFDLAQEPYRWSAVRFALESLLPPTQVPFKPGDPQMAQVSKVIHERLKAGVEVHILDYGAGRGRLAEMLNENSAIERRELLKYLPVEQDVARHEALKAISGPKLASCGVQGDIDALPREFQGKITVAVLCNVLHEVRPTRWVHELNSILKLLAEDGLLVICEDEELPQGERPHELGFIILDTAEIKTLFSLAKPPAVINPAADAYTNRIRCWEVSKKDASVTGASVRSAVTNLQARLLGELRKMSKSTGNTAAQGRRYGMYSQMFLNCTLALEELSA